jgi:Zn-dependent protease with chaperone function
VPNCSYADATASEITDTAALKEQRASLLQKLGKAKEAEAAYRDLLQSNSENYKYHRGLQLVGTRRFFWHDLPTLSSAVTYTGSRPDQDGD